MLRRPILILLGGCFLTASAACADEVGYVECSNHPEDTKVLSRATMIEGVVAFLPCGERFTILQSGFFFSRIQTKYGKVGYVLSSLISRDYAASSVPQPTSAKMTVHTPSDSVTSAAVTPSKEAIPAQAHPRPAPPAAAAPASAPQGPQTTAFEPNPNALTQPQPTPAAPATPSTAAPALPSTPALAPRVNLPEAVVQPNSAMVAQPEPEPAPPTASALRPASGWRREEPIPHFRRAPLIELFGGYGFARLSSGSSNLNGALGSFSWNVQSWLQIMADSSYNFVTANGVKTVLYGNHYGPRFFLRGRNRRGATPFVEVLFGGSRADTTVSGAGGYTASDQSLSVKAGGGLDVQPSRHLKIRLFDVDYYRTAFGVNAHQNNYWASAGIVVRLFGGASE